MTMISKRLWMALGVAGMLLVLPAVASATYPGRAGALAYLDFHSTDSAYPVATWSLDAERPSRGGGRRVYGCQATSSGSPAAGGVCPELGVGFSPDGKTIVFTGGQPSACFAEGGCVDDELFVGDLAGHARPLPLPLPLPLAYVAHPAFMPDGQTIVFAAQAQIGGPTDLYLVGSDGSGLRQITTGGGTNPAPCADGQIVYNRDIQLYVLSANLSTQRHLTQGSLGDCSPDSRRVVFLKGYTLHMIDLNGRHPRRLSAIGAAAGRPTFSPAGSRIAYVHTDHCTQNCSHGGCDPATYALTTINLTGSVLDRRRLGSSPCTNAGTPEGDMFGQLAWQPLP
jgi:hypothetical protein